MGARHAGRYSRRNKKLQLNGAVGFELSRKLEYREEDIARLRRQWQYTGNERPRFALQPRENQESVWDYPRPPRVEKVARQIKVMAFGKLLGESSNTNRPAVRVLETGSPPVYYVDRRDIDDSLLVESTTTSLCEWKGLAHYFSVKLDLYFVNDVGWYYPKPFAGYELMKDYVGFYPSKVSCFLDEALVRAQKNRFYGGWITSDIVGPFNDEVEKSGLKNV